MKRSTISLIPVIVVMLLAGLVLTTGRGAEAGRVAQSNSSDSVVYLPAIFSTRMEPGFDMAAFMIGDGRLYEVMHSSGSQARHQTQTSTTRFYHTKGNEFGAEWEELWVGGNLIFRGTDTSPGNDQYYTLYENGLAGSAWSPRYWSVGEIYERNPYVVFYRKDDCGIVASGYQRSWLRFEGYYPTYTFKSGLRLNDVVELTWLLQKNGQPIESYFYARSYGLVGWGSDDRGFSYINEIHAPGQRPDNKREAIGCLDDRSFHFLRYDPELNFGPLPPEFRAK